MVSEPIPNSDMGSVPFGSVGGVCLFVWPYNLMMLYPYEGCLSHPISDKGETS